MRRRRAIRRRHGAVTALVAITALCVWCPAYGHDDLAPALERIRARAAADSADTALAPSERAERWLEEGEFERIAGQIERAEVAFDRAERADPAHPRIPLCRAALAADRGRWQDAERLLQEAAARAPGDARVPALRSRVLLASGRPREALVALDRSLALSPRPRPEDWLERARQARALDGPGAELAGLEIALGREPESVPLVLRAAEVTAELGRADDALARLAAVIERCAGGCPELEARRGALLELAGRRLEAEAEWSALLARLEPLPRDARPAERALVERLRRELGLGSSRP